MGLATVQSASQLHPDFAGIAAPPSWMSSLTDIGAPTGSSPLPTGPSPPRRRRLGWACRRFAAIGFSPPAARAHLMKGAVGPRGRFAQRLLPKRLPVGRRPPPATQIPRMICCGYLLSRLLSRAVAAFRVPATDIARDWSHSHGSVCAITFCGSLRAGAPPSVAVLRARGNRTTWFPQCDPAPRLCCSQVVGRNDCLGCRWIRLPPLTSPATGLTSAA